LKVARLIAQLREYLKELDAAIETLEKLARKRGEAVPTAKRKKGSRLKAK